jgi:hypothetical protein
MDVDQTNNGKASTKGTLLFAVRLALLGGRHFQSRARRMTSEFHRPECTREINKNLVKQLNRAGDDRE